MSDFRTVRGFEDVWRPPVGRRVQPEGRMTPGHEVRARLARIARGAPEVMVKVAGRTRDPGHLAAHLSYITRQGELAAEDRDGNTIKGLREVRELAEHWSAAQLRPGRGRANSPFSVGIVLSMPAGVDPLRLRDAARDFAQGTFGGRHDYLLALHTDAAHPHVHLTVRALGDAGERLNPKKADLEAWRQDFARALRERGVEAEATPRRARGVTRKAERMPLRKLRERFEAREGAMGMRERAALQDAAKAAFGKTELGPWDSRLVAQQQRIRRLYLAQARLLQASLEPGDRDLGKRVEAFVEAMPPPDTERLALARALRAANRAIAKPPPDRTR